MSFSRENSNVTTSNCPAHELNYGDHGRGVNTGSRQRRGGPKYNRSRGGPRGRDGERGRDLPWGSFRSGENRDDSAGRQFDWNRGYRETEDSERRQDEWAGKAWVDRRRGGRGYRGRGGRGRDANFNVGNRGFEERACQQDSGDHESDKGQPLDVQGSEDVTQREFVDGGSFQRSRGRWHNNERRKEWRDGGSSFGARRKEEDEAYPDGQQLRRKPQPSSCWQRREEEEEEEAPAPVISTNPNRVQRAPNLRKNCHDEKEIEQLFERHHQQKGISLENYASIPVEITPNDIEAVQSFEELYVEPALSANIAKCGYKDPTPVQRYGIPVCLEGHDLMACAQTGSGKTAAFLVPVVHYILKHGVSPAVGRVSHPIAVIMAPTRELAQQIHDEVRKLTFRTDIFFDVAYGGIPYPSRFENDILVACPGRLKDIFDRGVLSFSRVKFLILDEADRMLEMGFEEQIEYLVASRYTDMPTTKERQTLMFSATFPQRILNLAKRYLRSHYYLLTVGRVGSTTKNITQRLMRVQEDEKMNKLFDLILNQKQTDLVLIFVETKRAAEDLHHALKSSGIPSSTIHGDRKQMDRERALRDFKDGVTPILVATDVASRGLDIPNVAHVIQYDLPKEMDDYTHRIGRTGRAGNKGIATSFYTRNNRNLAVELFHYLREHEQEVPVWLDEEKDAAEGDRFLGAARGGSRRDGGGESRPNTTLSNSTWGEAAAARGGRRGGTQANHKRRFESYVDDGGF
ncbi:putative ATP-dependent RNA helicase [Trypanosoma vivax]|nr:putative ATP-dependent RNA helicase [Trypanosoma vivax]